jgi:hypothetical protein
MKSPKLLKLPNRKTISAIAANLRQAPYRVVQIPVIVNTKFGRSEHPAALAIKFYFERS